MLEILFAVPNHFFPLTAIVMKRMSEAHADFLFFANAGSRRPRTGLPDPSDDSHNPNPAARGSFRSNQSFPTIKLSSSVLLKPDQLFELP